MANVPQLQQSPDLTRSGLRQLNFHDLSTLGTARTATALVDAIAGLIDRC